MVFICGLESKLLSLFYLCDGNANILCGILTEMKGLVLLSNFGRIAFFHFVLNPEWTVLKTLALLPVSLIKGKNLLTRPIKISGKPAVCKLCDDTGFMKMHDITLSLIPCSCPIGIKYKKQTWPAMRWECPNCHETSFPKNC